ncbi:Ribulose bisphosphate carboxylase large chain [Lecanora helva]
MEEKHKIYHSGCSPVSPTITGTIPSSKPNGLTIPLRTLASPSQARDDHSEALLDEKHPRRRSSDSAGSDFSLWSDTGDLAEQLADEEDPLRIQIRESGEEAPESKPLHRRSKHVHYGAHNHLEHKTTNPGLSKEAIEIPNPPARQIGRTEKVLAIIMTGDRQKAQSQGLTGKPLLYVLVVKQLGAALNVPQPTRAEIGTMVAILEVGAFIASLSVGRIGDMLGRRKTILFGSIVFFIGGAFQTFANGMPMMIFGRIIAGLGVGALSTIVPVYQSEISPPHNRGKLACIEFSGNISGYAASVWVDYFCSYIPSDYAWRVPLLLQCFMGFLLGIGSLIICESPRWLLDNDHDEEGIVVIANLYGGGDIHNDKAKQEYREIKMNVLLQRQEGERTYYEMFRKYYKRLFIAMSAQALAQLNGINVISYYAPLVFESAGWVGRDAILMTGINGLTYLLATVPPWYLVDKWGRRMILLSGAVAMILSLSAISYFIFIDVHYTPQLTVIFVMIYNAAFGASWGPIPWLYPPEILPLSIRAKGASLSTAANWACNWLVGEMTPILQEWIKWRLYLVHAFFCAVSFVLVYFLYPETANVRLEDMDLLFGDATTAMPTPAQHAEVESLMSEARSPVPSLDIRRGPGAFTADNAIPGLDINPPSEPSGNGKAHEPPERPAQNGGLGGWISSMIQRTKGNGKKPSGGAYGRLGQDEE